MTAWRGAGPWASQAGGGGSAGAAVAGYTYRYAHWAFDEGTGNLINAQSNAYGLPAFSFAGTLDWSTPGAVTTATGGNVMDKVVGDAAVDALFELAVLDRQTDFKCKLWAVRLRANTLPAANSRIGQSGDQGSAQQAGVAQRGGWVWRFNGAGSPAPFTQNCLSCAIHTPYNLLLGDKAGSQGDADYVDPIVTDPTPIQAGVVEDFLFGVDASRGDGQFYAMLYRAGAFVAEDVSADPINYPLPGISDVQINGSRGLRLFSQSDATGQAPLKDFTLYDMWVGEARDTAHLAQIAARLHADSAANPY